jgi:hypothetical protein
MGYNQGEDNPFFGKKHSEETRKKLRLAKKKRREKLGYLISPEARKKISKSNRSVADGRYINSDGYAIIYKYDTESRRSYTYEHIIVIEKYFGRKPIKPENTHHVNEVKSDNRIKNLILFKNKSAHVRYHWNGETGLKTGDIVFDGRNINE